MRGLRRLAAFLVGLAFLIAPARATWSIVVVNTKTGEVCVAGASCLNGVKKAISLVRVGHGAAATQSVGDSGAAARMVIWDAMEAGLTPDEILQALVDAGINPLNRQYGIVDLHNTPATFTGAHASAAAGGVFGVAGDLRYAIQGNVMTGPEVWLEAEIALLTTEGDLSQKAMAAMEAARSMGGDGRCSCSVGQPTSCGAPPPFFRRTCLSAFIVLARVGDREGICNYQAGCVSGEYYLNAGYNGNLQKPDPVHMLQRKYAVWRNGLVGVPDQVHSQVTPPDAVLEPGGVLDVQVELRDLEGGPVDPAGLTLSLEHLQGGLPVSKVSAITSLGGGFYTFSASAKSVPGHDTWRVWVETLDGKRVALQPDLQVVVATGE